MSRAEYLVWAERQGGRHERVDGRMIRREAERGAHVRMKGAIFVALRDAVRLAGVPCQVLTDGVTIAIGDRDYEPDATVNLGAPIGAADLFAPNPVIVVEVLSPGSETVDTGRKLVDYFRVPGIQHYLVIEPLEPLITWHRRLDGLRIETRICPTGMLRMDPPDIAITVEEVWAIAHE